MGFDTTAADAVLKDDYQGPVREQLNNGTVFLKLVKKNRTDFEGRQAILPVHKGRNVGVGARLEGAALPTAGNQQYAKAIYDMKYMYGSIELTGPVISATKTSPGAFLKALDSEMQGLVRDLKVDVNRQVLHDGSCILTQCDVTSAVDTVEVNDTKFLEAGMQIDIRNGSDGAEIVVERYVESVTNATQFEIVGAAITTDVNDVITRTGTRGLSGDGFDDWGHSAEMFGLEVIVSASGGPNGITDYLGQINRATAGNEYWKANDINNSGTPRALTLDLMQQAFDLTEIEGDAVPGLILTSHAVKRKYAALLIANKRYPPGGEITLDGGYSALEFNGVPLVSDKDASITLEPGWLRRLYFLTMSTLEYQLLEDWQWMEKDGAVLHRVTGYDKYQAVMYSYLQLACNRCNANTLLDDITE